MNTTRATFDVAVIIVNYNVKAFLHFCLLSVYAATSDLKIQIIVVDNHSTDDSVTFLKKYHPEIILIQSDKNVGFSRACNIGFKASSAEYALFLNPDMIISEDSIYECIKASKQDDTIGAIGIKLIDGTGHFLPESKRGNPTPMNTLFKQLGFFRLFPESAFFNGYYLGHLDENKKAKIEVLTGAFFFIPSSLYEKLDGFDERFFMYGEDIDLSYQIRKKGHDIIYLPTSTAIHFKGESTKKESVSYFKSFYGSMMLFVNKHGSIKGRSLFRMFLGIGIFFSGFWAFMKKLLSFFFRPLIDWALISSSIYMIAQQWAAHFHQNINHFESKALLFNILIYASIWIFSLFIHGHYKKPPQLSNSLKALLNGLLVILVLYALWSENFRNSRAVILMGFTISCLVIPLLKLIFYKIAHPLSNNKIYSPNPSDTLNYTLLKLGLKPSNDQNAAQRVYTIGEYPFKKMISQIINNDSKYTPYFWDNSKNLLISSYDKSIKGLSIESAMIYSIKRPSSVFLKRCFDIVVSILLLFLYPISDIYSKFENYYIKNIWYIFRGRRTIFSYQNSKYWTNIQNELPKIKNGFWPMNNDENNEEQILRIKNYALHYSIMKDVILLISNFKTTLNHLTNHND